LDKGALTPDEAQSRPWDWVWEEESEPGGGVVPAH